MTCMGREGKPHETSFLGSCGDSEIYKKGSGKIAGQDHLELWITSKGLGTSNKSGHFLHELLLGRRRAFFSEPLLDIGKASKRS